MRSSSITPEASGFPLAAINHPEKLAEYKAALAKTAADYLARYTAEEHKSKKAEGIQRAHNFQLAAANATRWEELAELVYLLMLHTQYDLSTEFVDAALAAVNVNRHQIINLANKDCCEHAALFLELTREHAKHLFEINIASSPSDIKTQDLIDTLEDAAEETLSEDCADDDDIVSENTLSEIERIRALHDETEQHKEILILMSAIVFESKATQLVQHLKQNIHGLDETTLPLLRRDAELFSAREYLRVASALEKENTPTPNTLGEVAQETTLGLPITELGASDVAKLKTAISTYLSKVAKRTRFQKMIGSKKEGCRRALMAHHMLARMGSCLNQDELKRIVKYILDSSSTELENGILRHLNVTRAALAKYAEPIPQHASKKTDDAFYANCLLALDVYQIYNMGGVDGKLRAEKLRVTQPGGQFNIQHLLAIVLDSKSTDLKENILQATGWSLKDFEDEKAKSIANRAGLKAYCGIRNHLETVTLLSTLAKGDARILFDLSTLAKKMREVAERYLQRIAPQRSKKIENKIRNFLDALNTIAPNNVVDACKDNPQKAENKVRELIKLYGLLYHHGKTGIEEDMKAALQLGFGREDIELYFAAAHFNFYNHSGFNVLPVATKGTEKILDDGVRYWSNEAITPPTVDLLTPIFYPHETPEKDQGRCFAWNIKARCNQIALDRKTRENLNRTNGSGSASDREDEIKQLITLHCIIVFQSDDEELKSRVLQRLRSAGFSKLDLKKWHRHYGISTYELRQEYTRLSREYIITDWPKLVANVATLLEFYLSAELLTQEYYKQRLFNLLYTLKQSTSLPVSDRTKHQIRSFLTSAFHQFYFPFLKETVSEHLDTSCFYFPPLEKFDGKSALEKVASIFALRGVHDGILSSHIPEHNLDPQTLKIKLLTVAEHAARFGETEVLRKTALHYIERILRLDATDPQYHDRMIAITLSYNTTEFANCFKDKVAHYHFDDLLDKFSRNKEKQNLLHIYKEHNERNTTSALFRPATAARDVKHFPTAVKEDWAQRLYHVLLAATKHYIAQDGNGIVHTAVALFQPDSPTSTSPSGMSEGRRRAENLKKILESMGEPKNETDTKYLAMLACAIVLHNPHTIEITENAHVTLTSGSQKLSTTILVDAQINKMQLEILQHHYDCKLACQFLSERLIEKRFLESKPQELQRNIVPPVDEELGDLSELRTRERSEQVSAQIPSLLDPTLGNWDKFWNEKKQAILAKITELLPQLKPGSDVRPMLRKLKVILELTSNTATDIAQVLIAFSTIDGAERLTKRVILEPTGLTKGDLEYLQALHFNTAWIAQQARELQRNANPTLLKRHTTTEGAEGEELMPVSTLHAV